MQGGVPREILAGDSMAGCFELADGGADANGLRDLLRRVHRVSRASRAQSAASSQLGGRAIDSCRTIAGMSAKRDYVGEVLEVRARREELHRVLHRLDDLERVYGTRAKPADTKTPGVDDFVPIRIVTVLEVFMRRWIAALVNRGTPFVQNAARLAHSGKVRLDFDAAVAMRDHLRLGTRHSDRMPLG